MRASPLTRRQALQAVGSSIALSVAGCSVNSESDDTPTKTTAQTETATQTATDTPTRTLTADLSPVEPDDLSLYVEVLQQFTAEHPARIEASLENVSEQPVTATGGPAFHFGFSTGTHTERDATLRAIPHDNSHLATRPDDPLVPREPTDGCWTVDYELRTLSFALQGELSPGEIHRLKYTILDDDNDSCLPEGAYQLTYSLDVRPGTLEDQNRYEHISLTFACTLTIDEENAVSVEVDEPHVER